MMSAFPGSPRLLKGGLVLMDAETGVVERVIALQYNPDTLNRTLQPQGAGAEGGDRLETLRLKGPPVETIKLDAEIDAADSLEFPENNPATVRAGIAPELALLETMLYPSTTQLQANDELTRNGSLEIIPAVSSLVLFVWSRNRVVPVRITEFAIAEEAFDPQLNPIRARVTLGLRVLSINDMEFTSRGGSLYLAYHQQKEILAQLAQGASIASLGLTRLP
jgi:hypothetical protein